jgi:hypothetical protein
VGGLPLCKVTQKSGALSVHWRTKDSNLVCEFRENYGMKDAFPSGLLIAETWRHRCIPYRRLPPKAESALHGTDKSNFAASCAC